MWTLPQPEQHEGSTMPQNVLTLTRRELMVGAAALAATGGSVAAAPATTVARGTVFDADSSPRKGMPDVMVSNGLDVVKTGPDGSWSLPVRDGDSIFVIKPAEWSLPEDPATRLP